MGLLGRLEKVELELMDTKAEVASLREMVAKGRQDLRETRMQCEVDQEPMMTLEANALTFMAAVHHPLSELFYPGCRGIALHQRVRNCIQAAVSEIPEAPAQPSRKVELLKTLLAAIHGHKEVLEG